MNRVAVWEATDLLSAVQWRARLLGSPSEVTAVLEEGHADDLRELLIQLGGGDLIASYRPVGDALKMVEGESVVGEVDRRDLIELSPPFAFRSGTAQAVLALHYESGPIDLLAVLAEAIEPKIFRLNDGDVDV